MECINYDLLIMNKKLNILKGYNVTKLTQEFLDRELIMQLFVVFFFFFFLGSIWGRSSKKPKAPEICHEFSSSKYALL